MGTSKIAIYWSTLTLIQEIKE